MTNSGTGCVYFPKNRRFHSRREKKRRGSRVILQNSLAPRRRTSRRKEKWGRSVRTSVHEIRSRFHQGCESPAPRKRRKNRHPCFSDSGRNIDFEIAQRLATPCSPKIVFQSHGYVQYRPAAPSVPDPSTTSPSSARPIL